MRLLVPGIADVRHLLGPSPAGRAVTLYDDDVVIASYPRSGNTWMRFLVAHVIDPSTPAAFPEIDKRVPNIYEASNRKLQRERRPRVLKSHEYFDPRYPKVLYLVRDPRDVAVSYYYFLLRQRSFGDDTTFEAFGQRFLDGSLNRYGSWGENAGSWLGARLGSDRFMVVRYEDLHADTPGELRRVATFLGLDDGPRVEQAIAASSFESMQHAERAAGRRWRPARHVRREIPFVRRGRVGEGEETLPAELVTAIEHAWREQLELLGYPLRSDDRPRAAPSAG